MRPVRTITLAVCLLSTVAAIAAPRPRIAPIRQAENWSALADPDLRTHPLDDLKSIRLGAADRLLTLGAEVRLLNELYDGEAWGAGAQQDHDASWLLRTLIHGDLRWGGHARAFVQLGSGLESGRTGGPRPADEADLYLNAGFLELGSTLPGDSRLDLRLGRMEMLYGWGRLICFRGRPTLKRSHDGGLLRWQQGRARIDVFLTWDVRRRDGTFASERLDDHRLVGLYHSRPLGGGHGLDVYALATDRPSQAYFLDPAGPAPSVGAEDRRTLGARWELRRGIFYTDLEVSYQTGTFRPAGGEDMDISALGAGTMTRLRWPGRHRPELGLDLGWTSGDDDPADGTLGTFRAPAPGAAFLGGGHDLGYGNLGLVHALAAARPVAPLRVQTGMFLYWRPAEEDGSYALPGRPYIRAAASTELGITPELIITWNAAPYTTLELEITAYPSAGYQDQVTPGDDLLFVSTSATFAF